jgi:hypothetical protein
VWRLNGRKGTPGDNWEQREVIGQGFRIDRGDGAVPYGGATSNRNGGVFDLTAPATADAARWNGWGTALKPAFEPIVVARKPLTGTVAANVLQWGTGALNIDASRIAGDVPSVPQPVFGVKGDGVTDFGAGVGRNGTMSSAPAGRWPSNVALDASQAAALDQQSGTAPPKPERTDRKGGSNDNGTLTGYGSPDSIGTWPADGGGGASRFFRVVTPDPPFRYTAKAGSDERPGVDGVSHPTVKPVDLMRWLVKLVTPPGGVVLEPFAGSGTTVEAAVLEGFRCIAIEREADYLPLILQRIRKPHAVGLDLASRRPHRRRDLPVTAVTGRHLRLAGTRSGAGRTSRRSPVAATRTG